MTRWTKTGLLVVVLYGARGLQAQAVDSLGRATPLPAPAFDSLGRPRPLLSFPVPQVRIHRICEYCHYGPPPAVRIIGAAKELLFMSPADSAARSRLPDLWKDFPELNPSDVDDVTVVKSIAAIERFGSAYEGGVIIVTLNQKGTDTWRQGVATRKTKPAQP